jgi:hypothetical protein
VLNKLHRGLTAVGSWCQRWNIKINEGKTQAIYFSKRRMTWRPHIEKFAAKALGAYIRTYCIFRSKHLNANIKLIMYRAIMTYACPTREFAADTHLMKLQRLQNRVLRAISKLDRFTPIRDLHLAFKIPYVYDYITKLYRRQAEVILDHENLSVVQLDKEKPGIGNIRGLNLATVKSTIVQVSDCRF